MTDVELHSTARSGGVAKLWVRVAAVGGAVVTVLTFATVAATRSASADSLATARAEAAQIEEQLRADQQHLDVVSQQYDAAEEQAGQIDEQIDQTKATIAADQARVDTDQSNLRLQAVAQYMTGSDDTGVESFFESGGAQAAATEEYQSVATANVSDAIDDLDVAQAHLATQEAQLHASEAQAQSVLGDVAAAQQEAQSTVSAQEATLAEETGRVATLVAQEQAAQAQAEHTAFVSRVEAHAAAIPLPNAPASGSAGRAVAAAESQIGVPYHWGAEEPGVGFDCSGLTQWSWGQAGVGIPRTAQEQYDAITHIALSDIEPGDLLFWGDGTGDIYHVGMYVGGGDMVDAPQTGQDVQIQPVWDNGLVGAGRP